MANKGDTISLILDYEINDQPLIKDAYDDIELQLNPYDKPNSIQLLLSKNEIIWDNDLNKYVALLTQAQSFKLSKSLLFFNDDVCYQLRIYIDNQVISDDPHSFPIGKVLSNHVFGGTD